MSDKVRTLGGEFELLKRAFDYESGKIQVLSHQSLIPAKYDEKEINYISSGNGIGEPGLIVYKYQDQVVCILNIEYDAQNRVTKLKRVY